MAWTVCMSDADISTLTTAYTVPAGVEARLTAAFCNRSTSATATVSLWVVPQGETRGNEHLKESGTTLGLAGTSQAVLERSFVAPEGCIIYVQASTANVSCQVQGDVVQVSSDYETDGTSSISLATNVTNATGGVYPSGEWYLRKRGADIFLNIRCSLTGAPPTNVIFTLPTGYRPSANLILIGAYADDVSANSVYPYTAYVATNGEVQLYQPLLVPISYFNPASGDKIHFNFSFKAS